MNSELDTYLTQLNTKEDWDEVWAMTKARYGMFEAQQGRKFKVGESIQFDIDTGRQQGRGGHGDGREQ